jgi:hypothetical protein
VQLYFVQSTLRAVSAVSADCDAVCNLQDSVILEAGDPSTTSQVARLSSEA